MNAVHLSGKVASEIKLRTVQGREGQQYEKVSLIVAVRRPRGGDGPPDWVRVEAWGVLARNLVRFNRKGSRLVITGRLRSEFYEPTGAERGGQLRYAVVADRIEFMSPPVREVGEEANTSAKGSRK